MSSQNWHRLDLFVVWGDAVDLVMVMMMRQADKACERRGGYSGEERNGGVGDDRSAIEPRTIHAFTMLHALAFEKL